MTALSVVIPSHNRADLLRACLAGVRRHAPSGTQVLVVDDASPGASVSAAAREAGVEVIRLEERGGFCRAANAGLNAARHSIVELLNDDTEVCPGWADAALAAFSESSVGAVAPLVLRWPGGPAGQERIDSAGDCYHLGGFARKRGHGLPLTASYLSGQFVFGASGSSAFYRRDALLRVGLFPESFGAYFEDVDLSFRLRQAGYRIWYEPASRVLHHVSASHGAGPELLEQQSRNEELVFWRNVPACVLPAALPLHLLVLLGKAWRRWRRGELVPFLRGRLQAVWQGADVLRHRRRLQRLSDSGSSPAHSTCLPASRSSRSVSVSPGSS
jgi:GT2 family glycosyltransferase